MIQYFAASIVISVFAMACVLIARIMLERRAVTSARARGLFEFHDGQKMRALDPIAILRALDAHPKYRLDLHPKLVIDGNNEAMLLTVDTVREVFGVVPFDRVGKPGLTAEECLRLLDRFIIDTVKKKKSSSPSPTCAQSLDAIWQTSDKPIRELIKDCGLTATAPSPNSQSPSSEG